MEQMTTILREALFSLRDNSTDITQEKILGDDESLRSSHGGDMLAALQCGIRHSILDVAAIISQRDLLVQDFFDIYRQANFTCYSPVAFAYFRKMFQIPAQDFLISLCEEPLGETAVKKYHGNGATSVFVQSCDDKFIVKSIKKHESAFLRKILPGYYMNFNQNPKTFLPKFVGLNAYKSAPMNAAAVHLVTMNNHLPSSSILHEKYHIKGSTFNRKASKREQRKALPVWKDLDFVERHPRGITIDRKEQYTEMMATIARDCRVLESFRIMNYSLLIGIHYLKNDERPQIPPNGIAGRNGKGEGLILFIGIIDVLKHYSLEQRAAHSLKATVHDGDTISVHRPGFYSRRFQYFITSKVFRKDLKDRKEEPTAIL